MQLSGNTANGITASDHSGVPVHQRKVPMSVHEPNNRSSLSQHILPSSATMVGVCVTALSILKLVRPTGLGFWANHLLALSSLVFLTSGMLSYAAMRAAQNAKLERYADVAFIAGLLLLSLSTIFMAFVIP
jgi:hypothetical protein